ncbi:MAG: thiamine pyrophosphate-binding protein [Candidatus Binatia bacterium]
MARIDGGEMLIRVLEHQGIREVFTLHGGHLDAIFQAALDHGVRLIDTRHEQAAGHAADGWARTTGRPGVAIVTAGPGVTDVVTGVANAYLDCVPMLVVGGAAPLVDAETLPLQGGIDQLALMRPITKWAHRITHTHRIPDLVAQGLRVATTGRPGPVFLEIPADVLFKRVEESDTFFPQRVRPQAAPAPAAPAVKQAIEWLHSGERPAILAGGGCWFAGGGPELRAFADQTGIPVFANSKARGMVPDDHRLSGRSFMTLGVLAQMGGAPPDVVLVLGARLGLFTGGRSGLLIPAAARLIQVDIEGPEIGRNRDVELGITADCREALRALQVEARQKQWSDRSAWQQAVAQARTLPNTLFADALAQTAPPIHPYRLAHAIATAVGPDAIVVADGGETAAWMDMAAEVHGGGHWLSHGYLGCLGVGMPFAVAAKVAHPDRQVVCVAGDGSVGLNFAEFDTMVRHGLNIVTVVNNDRQWGMSLHGQELMYGKDRTVATALAPTRYDLAAAGLGCYGEQVEHPAELVPALQRALSSGRPACLNVMTDPTVIAPITQMMVAGATPSSQADEKVRMPYYGERDA